MTMKLQLQLNANDEKHHDVRKVSSMLLMLRGGEEGQSVGVTAVAASQVLAADHLAAARPLPGLPRSSRLHKHKHQEGRGGRQEPQHQHGATVAIVRVVREGSNQERPCVSWRA